MSTEPRRSTAVELKNLRDIILHHIRPCLLVVFSHFQKISKNNPLGIYMYGHLMVSKMSGEDLFGNIKIDFDQQTARFYETFFKC